MSLLSPGFDALVDTYVLLLILRHLSLALNRSCLLTLLLRLFLLDNQLGDDMSLDGSFYRREILEYDHYDFEPITSEFKLLDSCVEQ